MTNSKYQQELKPSSPKKSPARNGSDVPEMSKDTIKSRRRTYSGKRLRKEGIRKIEIEKVTPIVEDVVISVVEKVDKIEPTHLELSSIKDDGPEKHDEFRVVIEADIESEHETSEENRGKSTDECMDSSGESLEKPSTPGHQTTESEPGKFVVEIYGNYLHKSG